MKIVVDARTMGSKPSGIGMCTFNFIKEMIKNPKYQIILLTDVATSNEMQYMKEHDVEIREYGKLVYQSAAVFRYFSFVKKELKSINPELFWEPNNLIPVKLSGYHGKIMVTINDVFPISHKEYFSFKYQLYFKMMLSKTIRMADMLVYISNETKESVEKLFSTAAKKNNKVVYIPFDGGVLEETDTKSIGDYFLYVGNMETRKGVDLLIRAYAKYVKQGGTKRLVLAGKSRETAIDEMIQYAKENVPGFEYLGYIDDSKKKELMSQCYCFVFPSRAEGFGMSVLEAMQFLSPIIVSDLGIFKEIVGECISYFSLEGTKEEQIENLVLAMQKEPAEISKTDYQKVLKCYRPELLNRVITEFIDDCLG